MVGERRGEGVREELKRWSQPRLKILVKNDL
jgi:hypothetical protein